MLNNIVFVTIKDRVGLKASLMNIMLCHLRYDHDDLLFVFSTFHLLDFCLFNFLTFLFFNFFIFLLFYLLSFQKALLPSFSKSILPSYIFNHTFSAYIFKAKSISSTIHFQRALLPSFPPKSFNPSFPCVCFCGCMKIKCCLQKSV